MNEEIVRAWNRIVHDVATDADYELIYTSNVDPSELEGY